MNDPTGLATTTRATDAEADPAGPESEAFIGDPTLDPLAGAGQVRRMSSGVVLIVAVVLTAVAALFSMRKLAEATAATGIDSNIEATIEKFLTSIKGTDGDAQTSAPDDRSLRTVLAVLSERYSERQVPLRDVQRDPFVLALPAPRQPLAAGLDPREVEAQRLRDLERRREDRRSDVTEIGQRLRLKSIMGGSDPMAIIDGEIVHVGELVTPRNSDLEFRVADIGSASVDLLVEVPDLDLTVPVTLYLQRDR